jgi:hypothetical protein
VRPDGQENASGTLKGRSLRGPRPGHVRATCCTYGTELAPLEGGLSRACGARSLRQATSSLTPRTTQPASGEEPLDLRLKEFELLAKLAAAPGELKSREELAKEVWGHADVASSRVIRRPYPQDPSGAGGADRLRVRPHHAKHRLPFPGETEGQNRREYRLARVARCSCGSMCAAATPGVPRSLSKRSSHSGSPHSPGPIGPGAAAR